jgi:hypothetical protein
MTLIDEIQLFARDFINNKSFRLASRKIKIRQAYKELTGKDIKLSCHTCYIEALFEIINSKPMATTNYILKKGSFLQPFGHPELAGGQGELTDEKAKKILEVQPALAVYFEKMPNIPVFSILPEIKIIPPVKKEPEPANIIVDTLKDVSGEVQELKKQVIRKPKNKK